MRRTWPSTRSEPKKPRASTSGCWRGAARLASRQPGIRRGPRSARRRPPRRRRPGPTGRAPRAIATAGALAAAGDRALGVRRAEHRPQPLLPVARAAPRRPAPGRGAELLGQQARHVVEHRAAVAEAHLELLRVHVDVDLARAAARRCTAPTG